jgi:Dimerisation domain
MVSPLCRSPDIAYVPRKIPKLAKRRLDDDTNTNAAFADSPRSTLLNLIRGFRVSQMISVAAKLRIADLLAEGPKTVTQLARATSCHEDSLYRLLRALASIGVFAEEDGLSFCLSPCAVLLQSEVSGSLRTNAEVVGEEWMWLPWGSLLHSVKTGESACEHVYGKNTWDWFTENLSAGQLFDQFMDESTVGSAASVVAAYDFLRPRTVIDIAGGRAYFSRQFYGRTLPHAACCSTYRRLSRQRASCWTAKSRDAYSSCQAISLRGSPRAAICTF